MRCRLALPFFDQLGGQTSISGHLLQQAPGRARRVLGPDEPQPLRWNVLVKGGPPCDSMKPVMTSTGSAYVHTSPWPLRGLGFLGGFVLGAVLLVAGYAKLLDPMAFVEQIRFEGLDVLLSAEIVAFLALGLEAGLGLALVLGLRRLWVLVPTTLLVGFFLFLTGRTYWLESQGLLEEGSSCGCFGNLVQRTPAEAFWQDLVLLGIPLLLAWVGRSSDHRMFPPIRTLLVGATTVAAVVFATQAPDLPLDDLATRLKPGVDVGNLCTGAEDNRVCMTLVIPELMEGRHVVVMADLGEENAEAPERVVAPDSGEAPDGASPRAVAEAVPDFNDYALRGTGPRLWVVGELTPERENQLYWQWGPAFELRAAPASLLRPLYRRLPRSFLVEDGEVVETFRGLPPLAELAGARPNGDGSGTGSEPEPVQAESGDPESGSDSASEPATEPATGTASGGQDPT